MPLDLMNMPNIYFAPPLGVRELKIGEDWRAIWNETTGFPEGAPVTYGYAVVACDDKGFVTRELGAELWSIVEGPIEADEKPPAFVKRAAAAQMGASGGTIDLLGFFECRATSNNAEHPVGFLTIRPIYLMAAKTMKDLGRDTGWERRRLPMNEFAKALRDRYPQFLEAMTMAVDRYMVSRAKGAG